MEYFGDAFHTFLDLDSGIYQAVNGTVTRLPVFIQNILNCVLKTNKDFMGSDMGVSDKWPNFHFGVEYPFKGLFQIPNLSMLALVWTMVLWLTLWLGTFSFSFCSSLPTRSRKQAMTSPWNGPHCDKIDYLNALLLIHWMSHSEGLKRHI